MTDSVVAEIRRYREKVAARFDHNLDAIYRYYKQLERKDGRKYVNLTKAPRKRRKSLARI